MNVEQNKILCAAVFFSLAAGFLPAQQNPQTPPDSGAVIRTETKVVLVDAVVTDKKGNYLRDLTAKDFKVWEDNKEQKITSFSFEADPASPTNSQPRYIVLFFDNSSMDFAAQAQARIAAAKFIDANAGPQRMMAIVNFGGSLQIAQNFSSDAERLKAVVKGVKFSTVTTNDNGPIRLGGAAADFGVRSSILALRSLAKNLSTVPGRKSLILFTGGFPVTQEMLPEVSATISVCNKSNVAIYPIDVRGLVTPGVAPARGPLGAGNMVPGSATNGTYFRNAAFIPGALGFFQVRVPGGGGGPPTPPGGGRPPVNPTPAPRNPTPPSPPPARNPGGGGSPNPGSRNVPPYNPYNQQRRLIPRFPEGPSKNQDVMYMLAEGTGGFVIVNTNDLFGGLEKIGKELNEFYLLGYTPPEAEEGTCHILRVKVEHGANVRARTGYCNSKSKDLLAQSPMEKVLEIRAAGKEPGNVAASMQTPYFYTSDNVARVNVAMEISTESLKFDKDKGKLRSAINILGIANRPDGSVGARFSDTVKLEFEDKKQVEAFKEHPYHYENQFDIASGQYTLKIVFTSGRESFGKLETPLTVDPYDGKHFGVSTVAFSTRLRNMSQMDESTDAALIEDRRPLVAEGFQIIPSGTNKFKTSDKAMIYLEVYEPLLVAPDPAKPFAVALQIRVLDGKSGEKKVDTGLFRIAIPEKGGAPTIPLGLQVAINSLSPGNYRLELNAVDSAGGSAKRLTDFVIE
ncbi:MAG TPA: VWA domain-containing protein [Bryobacteraceae bacterium]|nr:VWA domain-containing protein [Bryobacteraceae bacterium]